MCVSATPCLRRKGSHVWRTKELRCLLDPRSSRFEFMHTVWLLDLMFPQKLRKLERWLWRNSLCYSLSLAKENEECMIFSTVAYPMHVQSWNLL